MDTRYQIEKSIIEELLLNVREFGFDELKRIKPVVEEAFSLGWTEGYLVGLEEGDNG